MSYRFSVEEYHQLSELGQISEKVELIRGAIVEKMSQSPLHASIVELLREYLTTVLPSGFVVRQEMPLTIADSEPEPDLAVVCGTRADFRTTHPSSAEVVIEVCVSSESLDRTKIQLYAEAGVLECWLVLAEQRVIERHAAPQGTAYREIERFAVPQTLPSTIFPQLIVSPPGPFPA